MYTLTTLKNGFTVTFSASFDGIDSACTDVKQFMHKNGLGDYCFDITLGIREVLSNAVLHGSNMNSDKKVFFSMEVDTEGILICVADSGPGFDWRQVKKKCVLSTATSGRGICILGQYFDSYRFNEIGNEVTLVKKIKEF